MINNLITCLKEEASEDAEHQGLTTNTQNEEGKDHNRGETSRYCGRARCFDGEFGNESGETLRPDVSSSRQRSFRGSEEIDPRTVLEASADAQRRFLRKACVTPSCLSISCPVVTTQHIVQRQVYKRSIQCDLQSQ